MNEPLRVVLEPTNNPNTIKVRVNRPLPTGRSYSTRTEAVDNPLADAILSVEGIQIVVMLGSYMTVTKHRTADWRTIGPAVQVKIHEALRY